MDKNAVSLTLPGRLASVALSLAMLITASLVFNVRPEERLVVLMAAAITSVVALTMNNSWLFQSAVGTFVSVCVGVGFFSIAETDPKAVFLSASQLRGVFMGALVFVTFANEVLMEWVGTYMVNHARRDGFSEGVEHANAQTKNAAPVQTKVEGFSADTLNAAGIFAAIMLTGGEKSPNLGLMPENAKLDEWKAWFEANVPQVLKTIESVKMPVAQAEPTGDVLPRKLLNRFATAFNLYPELKAFLENADAYEKNQSTNPLVMGVRAFVGEYRNKQKMTAGSSAPTEGKNNGSAASQASSSTASSSAGAKPSNGSKPADSGKAAEVEPTTQAMPVVSLPSTEAAASSASQLQTEGAPVRSSRPTAFLRKVPQNQK